ncbi:hypothetical protein [Altericista sp. CCNU0014]|uniref:hypothetical protein n=1 Tax=Altericista sp. CCNU0014 TaxID=3082949 RepID=UPI00384E3A45
MKLFNMGRFVFRPVRLVATILVSAFVFLTAAVPAFAFGTTPSSPTDATAQLGNIEREAQKVAESKVAPGSMQESEARAQGGINEVQGDADKDKMSRPSNSKDATTIRDEIGQALKKATNQD